MESSVQEMFRSVDAPAVAAEDTTPILSGHLGERRLAFSQKLAFGTCHVLQALFIALWFPYSVAFFTNVLEIPPASVGTIVLVAQVSGAVFTPFLGIWSDHIPVRKWRRKSFHLLGMVTGASCFFFLWHDCFNCSNVSVSYLVLYYSVLAVVFEFSWACVQIAQLSLIPELTADKNEKVELNSYRYFFTMSSFLTVFVIVWILLEKLYGGGAASDLTPADKDVFWITAVVVIGIGVLISFPFQFLLHENPNANPPKLKWYKWFGSIRFWLVLCFFTVTRVLLFFPPVYLPLYLLNTLHMDKASIAKAPLVLYIFSIVATLFVKRFNKFIGEKMTYFIGVVLVWAAMLWFWLKEQTGDQSSHFEFARDNIYGAAILLGIGSATCIVIALSMIAQFVGEYTGSSAFVYSWMLLGDRIINGVLVKIVQELHPNVGGAPLASYYRDSLVYPTLCASVAGVLFIALMKLQDMYAERKQGGQEVATSGSQAEEIWEEGKSLSHFRGLRGSNHNGINEYSRVKDHLPSLSGSAIKRC